MSDPSADVRALVEWMEWSVRRELQSQGTICEDDALSATTDRFLDQIEAGRIPDHPIRWLALTYRRELSRVRRRARRRFRDIDVGSLACNARLPCTASGIEELRRRFEQRFDEVEATLSPRQREVLDVLLTTNRYRDAAKALAISMHDLRRYRCAIVRKLRPLFALLVATLASLVPFHSSVQVRTLSRSSLRSRATCSRKP